MRYNTYAYITNRAVGLHGTLRLNLSLDGNKIQIIQRDFIQLQRKEKLVGKCVSISHLDRL